MGDWWTIEQAAMKRKELHAELERIRLVRSIRLGGNGKRRAVSELMNRLGSLLVALGLRLQDRFPDGRCPCAEPGYCSGQRCS